MAKASKSSNYYLPRPQLEKLLSRLGVDVITDTSTDLICFCPFHANRDSPAFNISLRGPHLWRCHNGKCAKQGNLVTLLMLKGFSKPEAEKMILHGGVEVDDLLGLVQSLMEEEKENANDWVGIDPNQFGRQDEASGWIGRDYFNKRGIHTESYEFFKLGYSPKKDMVVVPIFTEHDKLCGIIGREWRSKRYEYSAGLGKRNTIWNIHNAKWSNRIILTEGALDAIYLYQAGFENVGAVLGSAISPRQWKLIRKYFTEIICFFDNDDAGLSLTEVIIDNVRDLAVSSVSYEGRVVELADEAPNHELLFRAAKDPGDLSVEAIREMIETRYTSLDWILNKA